MENGTRARGEEVRPPLVRYQMMAILVHESPMSPQAFADALALHAQFLDSGGGGGAWNTFVTPGGTETGVVLGVYVGTQGSAPEGKQAVLDQHRLDGLDLAGVRLAHASLCGVSCRDQNLEGADLQGALLVDSDLSGSSFRGADLRHADLSRCDMLGCDLRDADLRQADLEYADLTDADLTGAKVARARLSAACTDGVRGLNEPPRKPARPLDGGAGPARRGPASRGGQGAKTRPPLHGERGRRPR